MSESRYFTVSCPTCGWIGSSEHAEGGHPIADAGDYSELLCPQCLVCEGISTELVDVEEVESDMSTHISYTGAGVDWHDSEAKAIDRLNEAIDDARSDAMRSGEWPCECDEWFVAKITHRVVADEQDVGTDYVLEGRT